MESEPGKGSTFAVYLPLSSDEAEDQAPTGTSPMPTGTERVLFVDDEADMVDSGRQILERLGYKVTTRTSSLEALETFRARPDKFDLVITDYTMPQMTGAELAREMLSLRPEVPVILCTGFSEQISAEQAEAMGIKRFLMKPLVAREMAEVIREVLEEKT